jgi:sugar phosphate isomerase/epimerase
MTVMHIRNQPPLHLTYCLNVHPGETWAENLAAIRTATLAVRDRVSADRPLGLGLRLSQAAVETLGDPTQLHDFRAFLADNGLYAFTINGFPYGAFHGRAVKDNVYRPDWSTPERRDYTLQLARVLTSLLPEGADGSISTLPLSYKLWPASPERMGQILINLADTVAELHRLHERSGKEIHLGLEPEPDCTLETTDEVIRFFEGPLATEGAARLMAQLGCSRPEAAGLIRRHLGICFDTCHLALQFEPLATSLNRLHRHGIRLSKIQLSSALETHPTGIARRQLADFSDPVYLHQVKALDTTDRTLSGFPDLPAALASPDATASALWRVHFHVPLYFENYGELHSTARSLDNDFWEHLVRLPVSHLEIETYTFHVLPPALQAGGAAASIVREFEWVRPRLQAALQRNDG